LRLAAAAAFLMFRFAALRCFDVATVGSPFTSRIQSRCCRKPLVIVRTGSRFGRRNTPADMSYARIPRFHSPLPDKSSASGFLHDVKACMRRSGARPLRAARYYQRLSLSQATAPLPAARPLAKQAVSR
jgi:hypothetical protein